MKRNVRKYLQSQPVFGIAAIKRFLGSNAKYSSVVLSRLVKEGAIKRITRNEYTTLDNIYLLATNLYPPSYLSFWSASQYQGYTEQIVNTIHVVTTSRKQEIRFEGYTIKFIVLPKRCFFGFQKINTSAGALFVADNEKLLLDSLLRPREMGNFDEIIKIVTGSTLDKEKLISYLTIINNHSLTKRVGYLVEKYKNIDLRTALKITDNNYISLNPFQKKSRQNHPKWRVKL